jgi:hypothetical protein
MTPPRFTDLQLSVSTAEEERSYFTGQQQLSLAIDLAAILPAGVYRIIEGELCRILPGVPPALFERLQGETQAL